MLSNLPYRQFIVKTHTENGMAWFFHLVNAVLDFSQLIQLPRDGIDFLLHLYRIKIAYLFLQFFLPDNIQATMMHGCHQITVRDACRRFRPHQPFKHVLHHILSFLVIPQQDTGQTNHPAVVLTKKPLKYLSIKHISLYSQASFLSHTPPLSRKLTLI